MAKVLLLNGPNLNLLGEREPELYGRTSLRDIEEAVEQQLADAGHTCVAFQSNSEGALLDWLHAQRPADFLLLNAAGLTHTSIVLRDAILGVQVPFVEVHLTNVHRREPFRHQSYFSDIAVAVIAGMGPLSYRFAAEFAIDYLARRE